MLNTGCRVHYCFTYMCVGSNGRESSGAASGQVILNTIHRNWDRGGERHGDLPSVPSLKMWNSSGLWHDGKCQCSPVLLADSPLFTEGELKVRLFWTPPVHDRTEHSLVALSITVASFSTSGPYSLVTTSHNRWKCISHHGSTLYMRLKVTSNIYWSITPQ